MELDFPEYPSPAPEPRGPRDPRWTVLALLSVLLGLASVPLLREWTAIPALILGFLALRGLNGEARPEGGFDWRRGLAIAGMTLGGVGLVLAVVGWLSLILLHLGEQSQRALCIDQLRRIGRGINEYHEAQGHFPVGTHNPDPALQHLAPWLGSAPEDRLAWTVAMLPYLNCQPKKVNPSIPEPSPKSRVPLDLEELQARFAPRRSWGDARNQSGASVVLNVFLCPASSARQKLPQMSYPGLAGIDPHAAFLPSDASRAGFFGYDRVVTRADVTAGLAYVGACVETAHDPGPWSRGGPATVRGLAPDLPRYSGHGQALGGLHPGGFTVLLVEGNVRFVADKVSPSYVRQLAALHGGF